MSLENGPIESSQAHPNRWDILTSVLLAFLVVLFFHRALIGGEQFYAGDTYRFFYPLKEMVAHSVRAGEAPVWNPFVHSGMPLHAALQAAVFYPPSTLFYVLPLNMAFKWYVAFHVLVAALGTYFLLRRWRIDPLPSALAGITYAFSGYVISLIDGLNIFSSIVWLPVVFLAFESAIGRPRISSLALAAIATAVQVLAGDPVSAYFTLLICGTYWIFSVCGSAFRRRPRGETMAVISVLPVIAVVTLFLCYVQLGPSQELTLYSTRTEAVTLATATRHSLDPLRLLTLAAPYVFGNPMESAHDWGRIFSPHFPLVRSLYVGAMPLVLLPLTIVALKGKRIYFFTGVFVVSLLLSLGSHTPLYKLSYHFLPMLSKFRYPVKYFFATGFAMAVLAGYGLQYMLSENGEKTLRARPFAGAFADRFSLVYLVAALIWVLIAACDGYVVPLSDGFFLRMSSVDASVASLFLPHMKRSLLQASFMFAILGALLVAWRKRRLSPSLLAIVVSAYVILDIIPTNYRAMDTISESFYSAPAASSFLREDDELFRLYRTPLDVEQNIEGFDIETPADYHAWNRELLTPNFGTLFGHSYTDGYAGANLLWHNLFLRFVESAPPRKRPRLLGLVNVKYIFSSRPITHPDLDLRTSPADNVFLYENLECLDRAYFVPHAVIAPDEVGAIKFIASNSFAPLTAVVLVDEGGPGSMNVRSGTEGFDVSMPDNFRFGTMNVPGSVPRSERNYDRKTPNPVSIDSYSANSVSLSLDAPSDGYVVLCDAYYPRWKATVNGKEVNMLRANCTVRAVPVAEGSNAIHLTYDTSLFRKAALISLISLVVCVGAAALDSRHVFRRSR